MPSRRTWLTSLLAGLALPDAGLGALAGRRLGVTLRTLGRRWQAASPSLRHPAFRDVLDVMDALRGHGVAGLQTPLAGWRRETAAAMRATCESYAMRVEGVVDLPETEGDVERLHQELATGRQAGMECCVVEIGGGHGRWEMFEESGAFRAWRKGLRQRLEWVEPMARRMGLRLALASHALESADMLALVESLGSKHIGVCWEPSAAFATLEPPETALRRLAPWVVCVRLHDLAVTRTDDGLTLAIVPPGQGLLDLRALLAGLEKTAPQALFSLDLPLRPPRAVPCLEERFWKVFPDKSGADLAHVFSWLKNHPSPALPAMHGLSPAALLELEEQRLREGMTHAADHLGFSQAGAGNGL